MRRKLGLIALVAASLAGAGCNGSEARVEPAPHPRTSAIDVQAAGDVTLSGRVAFVYGKHVFAVGSGPEQVLVVVNPPLPVTVGAVVEVSGRLGTFRRVELEAQLGTTLAPETHGLEGADYLLTTAARMR